MLFSSPGEDRTMITSLLLFVLEGTTVSFEKAAIEKCPTCDAVGGVLGFWAQGHIAGTVNFTRTEHLAFWGSGVVVQVFYQSEWKRVGTKIRVTPRVRELKFRRRQPRETYMLLGGKGRRGFVSR
jgi:hypothetical protein